MRFEMCLEGAVVPIPCDQIFVASSTWSARRTRPPDYPAVASATRPRDLSDNLHHASVQRQPVANGLCPLRHRRPMNSNCDDDIITLSAKPMTSMLHGQQILWLQRSMSSKSADVTKARAANPVTSSSASGWRVHFICESFADNRNLARIYNN